jgi:hypothetical protein
LDSQIRKIYRPSQNDTVERLPELPLGKFF